MVYIALEDKNDILIAILKIEQMKQSVILKHAIPFIQWFSFMIIIALLIDYILHQFQLEGFGRYLGILGTLVIISSFIYSLRKRKLINWGSPKGHLQSHEYLAWGGSILILVHAGIHFNALLPWLAVFMMLITVASGLVGKFLLKKSNETLQEKRKELLAKGITMNDAEKNVFFDTITVDLMKKWRVVHLPITFLFGVLALMHIITLIIFSK